MAILTLSELKNLWVDGFVPTQENYRDFFDTLASVAPNSDFIGKEFPVTVSIQSSGSSDSRSSNFVSAFATSVDFGEGLESLGSLRANLVVKRRDSSGNIDGILEIGSWDGSNGFAITENENYDIQSDKKMVISKESSFFVIGGDNEGKLCKLKNNIEFDLSVLATDGFVSSVSATIILL